MNSNSSYSQFKEQFSEEKLKDPAHQQELLGKLEKLAQNPDTQEKVADLIRTVNQSSFMEKIRGRWDGLSPITQKILFHNPVFGFGLNFMKHANPVRLLIRLDLLKYKGKLSSSDRNGISKAQKAATRLGVKLGKYFYPELKAVEPYLDPLFKLQEIKDNFINQTRARVHQAVPEVDLDYDPGITVTVPQPAAAIQPYQSFKKAA